MEYFTSKKCMNQAESSDKVGKKYMRRAIKAKAENIQHAGDGNWFGKLEEV